MDMVSQQDCDRIADKINQRPRKRYNYKTPEEMLYAIWLSVSRFKLDTTQEAV